jgi:hypothetical protein
LHVRSDETRLAEGEVPAVPDDDMIEHPDFQDTCRCLQSLRQSHIRLGWLRFAAGVIVEEDDGVGCAHDRDSERLARMHEAFIQTACAHEVVSADAEFRVQAHDDEAFTVGIEEGMLLDWVGDRRSGARVPPTDFSSLYRR